jgi:hypothetical protein
MIQIEGNAQGLSNIFNQKAADLKSVAKQIALLQLYIGWIQKGYSIARSGLNTIGEIKRGDFNLHSVFFSSLSSVNPAIRKYYKVGRVIDLVLSIQKQLSGIESIANLSDEERKYLITLRSNLFNECDQSLDVLTNLVSDDAFVMSDDERIKKIDGIYYDMLDRSMRAREFNQDARMVSEERSWEKLNILTLKNLE